VTPEAHGAQGPPSRAHWNFESCWSDENVNRAVGSVLSSAGPDRIVVTGSSMSAGTSIVQP
jgi:hypothetical protein